MPGRLSQHPGTRPSSIQPASTNRIVKFVTTHGMLSYSFQLNSGFVMRQLPHPANELGDRVLIDRHLAFTLEHAVEVTAGVIAQPQTVGVQAVGRVGRHVGTNAAVQHDGRPLAAADIFQRREAQACRDCRWSDAEWRSSLRRRLRSAPATSAADRRNPCRATAGS